jgi:CBS domain-containing protein
MATTVSRKTRGAGLGRLKAENLMESKPVSIRGTATVRSAVNTLNTYCFDVAPVTDKSGRLIGIVSRADLTALIDTLGRLRSGQHDCDTANITRAGIYPELDRGRADLVVRQVMSPEVVSVRTNASIAKIIEKFVKRRIRRLFVTNQDKVLVGEISIFELLRTLGECVDPVRISRQRP